MPISRDEVLAIYREMLNREPENEEVVRSHMARAESMYALAKATARSAEFAERILGMHRAGYPVGVFDGRHYETIRPGATYAPWRSDTLFLQTFKAIGGHTLVDLYRCWNLWRLVGLVAKRCGPQDHFIEIGVWRGGTGILIARRMALSRLSQPIFLCDTFAGVVKAGDEDPHYAGGEHADTSPAIVRSLASDLSVSNYQLCIGTFPDQMPAGVSSGPVAFCHIDVDTYASARDCLDAVWSRMIGGGMVVFDDYGASTTSGVAKLVDELSDQPDCIWQYNLNGHAVGIKVPSAPDMAGLSQSLPSPGRTVRQR